MHDARDCVQELAELLELCVNECRGDRDKAFDLFDQALEFEPELAAFMADERNVDRMPEIVKGALAPQSLALARRFGFADYEAMVEGVALLLRASNRLN